MKEFKGIFTALLTPFDKNDKINVAALEKLVKFNVDMGVTGFYVGGSTGEGLLLSTEERMQIMDVVKATAPDKTLIAHVGSLSENQATALAAYAGKLGYDAVSSLTPFYYKFTPDELRLYYTSIAEKSSLPLIAYYIPGLSGVTMDTDTLCSILDTQNVSGLKFTSNDFFTLERLRSARPEKLIFSGFDEMLLPMAVLGTNGSIGPTYNIIGHWAKKLYELVKSGDLESARSIQKHMNYVVSEVNDYGVYGTMKATLQLFGLPAGNTKAPMAPISFRQKEAARRIKDYIQKNQL
jgi:N-acetylneuraminate lyase